MVKRHKIGGCRVGLLTNKIKLKIENLQSKLEHGSFGRNVLIMFLGTAIGQIGPLLAAPILTRLYSPEMFGLSGAFTSTVFVAAVIACLRYDMAITLARQERDAANVIALCGLMLVLTTGVMTLVLLYFTPDRFAWADLGTMEPFRFLLPVGFFGIGAYQVLVNIATLHNNFKSIAQTKIYQGVTGPMSQIVMGFAQWGVTGLIIGVIIGQTMGISQLFWRLVIKKSEYLRGISWSAIRAMAVRYRKFPLISSWSELVSAIGSGAVPSIALPILYDSTSAGYVFLTDRIIGRPLLMISTSILQVYMGEVSKNLTSDAAAIKRRFLQLLKQQTVVVALWLAIVNLLADLLFPLLFGSEWAAAVPYLNVLSIALLPQLVNHALIHTLHLLERQGLSAAWEIGRLVAVTGALLIGPSLDWTALEALLAYSICQALAQIIHLFLMYRTIQRIQIQSGGVGP